MYDNIKFEDLEIFSASEFPSVLPKITRFSDGSLGDVLFEGNVQNLKKLNTFIKNPLSRDFRVELAAAVAAEKNKNCEIYRILVKGRSLIFSPYESRDDYWRTIGKLQVERSRDFYIITLPDFAGGSPIFYKDGGFKESKMWESLSRQIINFPVKLIILVNLQALVEFDITNSEYGWCYVYRKLKRLSQKSRACILYSL